MPRGNPTPIRSVRVPDDLWDALQALAEVRGETRSDLVVEALRRYIKRPPKSV